MTTGSQPTVSVVIPTLDGADILAECLRALARSSVALEVLVVDNGSQDNAPEAVIREWPAAHIIRNSDNLGYARACNQGAARATAPWLLFLNNDALVTEGCIEALVTKARESPAEAAIWQPPILSGDGVTWDSAGSLFTRAGFLDHAPGGLPLAAQPQADRRIFSAKGACMLVDRAAFERVGGFAEEFFAYFEETDLSWRLALLGRSTHFVDVPPVLHAGAVTSRRIFTDEQLDFMFFRNRLISLLSLAGRRRLASLMPLHASAAAALAFVALVTGRRGRARGILRAILWVGAHPGRLLARRRLWQRQRIWSDTQVLDAVTAAPGLLALARGGLHYLGNRPKT